MHILVLKPLLLLISIILIEVKLQLRNSLWCVMCNHLFTPYYCGLSKVRYPNSFLIEWRNII